MRSCRAWALIAFGLSLSGCVLHSVSGSGTIVTEPRSVSGFSAVALSGSGRVIIEQTGVESLTVTTDDNLLPHIRTEVRGDTLDLGFKESLTQFRPTKEIVFRLTVKQLDEVQVSGSGQVEAKGLTPDRLGIDISGSGAVAAQGTATDLDIRISGSGDYQGEQMNSRRASVHVSGSGGALVAASDRLDVNVSGSGSIEYVGDPKVTRHVSGSGSIQRR
jgi:hypothetical protein